MGAQSDIPLKQEEFEITETTGLCLRELRERGWGGRQASDQFKLKYWCQCHGAGGTVLSDHHLQLDFVGPIPVKFPEGEGGVSPPAWRVQEQEEQCLTPWKGPSGAVLFLLSLLLILGFSLFSPVSHREGKFRFELSKLMIVAKTPRDEL